MLSALNNSQLSLVRNLQAELQAGENIDSEDWRNLEQHQRTLAEALDIKHGPSNSSESFHLIQDHPKTNEPLIGPRWWFHLLGLRHGAVHIVLTTPQGWVVAQRRSFDKDDAPGALDISVSGHIGLATPMESAYRELEEELGLNRSGLYIDGELRPLGYYDGTYSRRANQNPPYLDRERRWLYTASLTPEGVGKMRFADGEVISVMLVGNIDLERLKVRCLANQFQTPGELDLAPGIIDSLPRWMDALNISSTSV